MDIFVIAGKNKKEQKKEKPTENPKEPVTTIFGGIEEAELNEFLSLWKIRQLDITMMSLAKKVQNGHQLFKGTAYWQDLGPSTLRFISTNQWRYLFWA